MKAQYNGKKLRYGSSGLILSSAVIAAVILLNVFVSALAERFSWMYLDMTPEDLYSITDDCFDLIEKEAIPAIDEMRKFNQQYNASEGKNLPDVKEDIAGETQASNGTFVPRDENVKIVIYFMDDEDVLLENSYMRYVIRSTQEIVNKFPEYFSMKYINIDKNPSAVQKFLTTTLTTMSKTSVVIECGTEFRTLQLSRFFTQDPTTQEIWAYDGEKQLSSAILAITRAESPVCLIDMAHGEAFYDTQFLYTIEDAGFQLAMADSYLTTESIEKVEKEYGADVRLFLIYNPTSDFLVKSTTASGAAISDIDEIEALDKFLDGKSSLMVFMSPSSPVLPNLEEYLEEWGIAFDRHTDGVNNSGYMIKDAANSLTSDGHTVVSEYVTTGMGGQLTTTMRSVSFPKKVIFRNAMSIRYSDTFEKTAYDPTDNEIEAEGEVYYYGNHFGNGVSRSIYDMFVTAPSAVAMAGGKEVAAADEYERFRLMTVSCELRSTQENNYSNPLQENSYVIACGSTEFATAGFLQSAVYGNTDLLLSALSVVAKEPVPVGIVLKPFGDYTIDSITTAGATAWTICLAVIPAATALVSGVVVLVRRKYA